MTSTGPRKPQSIAASRDLSEKNNKTFMSKHITKNTGQPFTLSKVCYSPFSLNINICCSSDENYLMDQREFFPYTNLCDCPQVEQAIWPPGQDVLTLCKPVRHIVLSILSPSRKASGRQGRSLLLLGVSSVMDRQVIHNSWVSENQGGGSKEENTGMR